MRVIGQPNPLINPSLRASGIPPHQTKPLVCVCVCHLVDVVARLGGGLDVGHAPGGGALAAGVQRHAALVAEVGLVPDQQERDVLVVLHAQDLLPAATRGRGVAENGCI